MGRLHTMTTIRVALLVVGASVAAVWVTGAAAGCFVRQLPADLQPDGGQHATPSGGMIGFRQR